MKQLELPKNLMYTDLNQRLWAEVVEEFLLKLEMKMEFNNESGKQYQFSF